MTTTPEDSTRSLNDVLSAALQAEQAGVPVNWKDLAMTIYNVATQHIAAMDQQAEEPTEE